MLKRLEPCSLTKKKFKLSQIDEWYNSEGVQNFVRQGYTGKWYAKTQDIENPQKQESHLNGIMELYNPGKYYINVL